MFPLETCESYKFIHTNFARGVSRSIRGYLVDKTQSPNRLEIHLESRSNYSGVSSVRACGLSLHTTTTKSLE